MLFRLSKRSKRPFNEKEGTKWPPRSSGNDYEATAECKHMQSIEGRRIKGEGNGKGPTRKSNN